MGHFQPRPLEPALHIEPLVCLGTIEDRLITAYFFSDEIQRLNHFQSEFLPLLVFGYGDVFDMSYETEIVDTSNIKQSAESIRVRLKSPFCFGA